MDLTREEATTQSLLSISLSAAVPLWAMQFRDLSWDTLQSYLPDIIDMVASHGDNILYRSKKSGETAAAFNALAKGIAILSFCPGGVKVFGNHFEYTHSATVESKKLTRLAKIIRSLARRGLRRKELTRRFGVSTVDTILGEA
jgi:hypothetical protein